MYPYKSTGVAYLYKKEINGVDQYLIKRNKTKNRQNLYIPKIATLEEALFMLDILGISSLGEEEYLSLMRAYPIWCEKFGRCFGYGGWCKFIIRDYSHLIKEIRGVRQMSRNDIDKLKYDMNYLNKKNKYK